MSTTVDKSRDRVRRMFGQIAGRYDFLNHLLSLNIDRYWRWKTVRRVPPSDEGPVLDVCTGTGDLAIAYHRAARGRVAIVGADFCHEMLAIARRKGARIPAQGQTDGPGDPSYYAVRFVEADAMQLPFPSDHYQIVSVAFGLRNVADTDAGLAEMTRVCRPGGKVVVLEFSTPRWQPFGAVYGWYFRRVLPRIGQLFSRNPCDAYRYLPESVGEFPSGEQLVRRMEAAGLRDVEFHPLTLGVATLYIGTK